MNTEQTSKNIFTYNCQTVALNDEIVETNYEESRFPKTIPMMTMKRIRVKAVLSYHQPSPCKKLDTMWIMLFLHFINFVTRNN